MLSVIATTGEGGRLLYELRKLLYELGKLLYELGGLRKICGGYIFYGVYPSGGYKF